MTPKPNPFEDMLNAATAMMQSVTPKKGEFTAQDFEALWPKLPKDMMEMFSIRSKW